MKKQINIDDYITGFPPEIQQIFQQIRMTIKKAAPDSEEVISYGMPAFKLNGNLVWVGVFSKHIGFYPKVTGTEALKKELLHFKGTKGSVHFPLDKPIPLDLITEMVRVRFSDNLQEINTIQNK